MDIKYLAVFSVTNSVIRMPIGSPVNSLKHSVGRKRRDTSFVTETAPLAILSSEDFGRWAFGIVQPRHHGRTDIVKG
jgi:hypothetical protein